MSLITVLGDPDPRYAALVCGATTINFCPVLRIGTFEPDVIAARVREQHYEALVVTSHHAAQVLHQDLIALGCPQAVLAVGRRTSAAVAQRGFHVLATHANAAELVEAHGSASRRLLRLCALEKADTDWISAQINSRSPAQCDTLAVYRTQAVQPADLQMIWQLQAGQWLLFLSPAGASVLRDQLGLDSLLPLLREREIKLAALGPTTAQAVRMVLELQVDAVAAEASPEGALAAVEAAEQEESERATSGVLHE